MESKSALPDPGIELRIAMSPNPQTSALIHITKLTQKHLFSEIKDKNGLEQKNHVGLNKDHPSFNM